MIPLLIAADYPIYPQRIGGMDRFFWELDAELKRTGISPVWVFPETASPEHYLERGLEMRFVTRSAFTEDLTKVIVAEGGVEVLVTHFVAYNTRYPSRWKRAGARRLIAVDHMSRPMIQRSLGYRLRHFLKGCITFKDVSTVIAVSGFVRASIRRELGWMWWRKTKTIWNGVPAMALDTFDEAIITSDEFRICFIGYLIPEKGVHLVLDAAAALVAAGESIRITIAGDGPESVALDERASSLGIHGQVDFIGPTTRQMQLMREHDLVVIPSLWKEACPLVVLEAMMTGACILASDIGGIPELLGDDGGATAAPGDIEAWRAQLLALLRDPQRRTMYRTAAHRRALEHFSLARMVRDHVREIATPQSS